MSKQKPKSANENLPKVITRHIFFIRGHKVMLSTHLSALYGVETKVLIQAVKRNIDRFPDDFMFQLTRREFEDLKSQIVTSSWGGIRRATPYAFTEQGVSMLSSVLNSRRAIQVNILIMRTFVKLRELMVSNAELAKRIEQLEKGHRIMQKDINEIVAAVNQLLTVQEPAIGFVINTKKEEPQV